MRLSLRERKIAKKKEDILRSAAKLLSEKDDHKTTMEDIAAELLMTKGSIYYYFKNKEDLLYQCHTMILEQSIERIEKISLTDGSPADKLKKAMTEHIQFAIQEKSLFNIMVNPEQSLSAHYLEDVKKKRAQYEKYFDQFIAEGIASGDFPSLDTKMVRMIILPALNGVNQWYSPRGEKDEREIAELMSNYLLRILV
ncbi:TetR/AcrR family transcriptional regulator [Natribacillus halophilus]|uniref:DNA-binding transcriptional regulator, AcrR family n=1 Tax=Natribacillus halophilus TaxID=549003 RepID=A0A1G8PEA3_9BACI|nr:TetR/AcrR family transcriptional regulator [Natribacillus halophilus]SDI90891.1 DNA-binding transcriptional regulator, AcrR family [Natribacillus halophilus]